MPGPQPDDLSEEQLHTLGGLERQRANVQRHQDRYLIHLVDNEQASLAGIGRALGVTRQAVQARVEAARARQAEHKPEDPGPPA